MNARRSGVALLCLLAAVLLTGCYPDLDWRELRSNDGGFAVMFPAKPNEVTREVKIGGTALRLHMLSAEVNGMAFGVGYADLPADVDGNVLLAAARDGLVHNINGRISIEQPVTLPGLNGQEFQAEGTAQDKPMLVAARLLIGSDKLYQITFIGPREQSAEVDLAFYLGSFKMLSL
ncbi:MAG TPA: hypothetical protein VIQ28_03110 [Burkholderiales bacterium]